MKTETDLLREQIERLTRERDAAVIAEERAQTQLITALEHGVKLARERDVALADKENAVAAERHRITKSCQVQIAKAHEELATARNELARLQQPRGEPTPIKWDERSTWSECFPGNKMFTVSLASDKKRWTVEFKTREEAKAACEAYFRTLRSDELPTGRKVKKLADLWFQDEEGPENEWSAQPIRGVMCEVGIDSETDKWSYRMNISNWPWWKAAPENTEASAKAACEADWTKRVEQLFEP